MLTIFRGDDLAFSEYDRRVCIRLETFLDLTGWFAKFQLIDNEKTFPDISSRLITFGYTAEETLAFPLGKTYAKLTIYDSKAQIRQIVKVDVEILNKRPEHSIDGFITISIDNVVSDYNLLGNKPVVNGKTIVGVHDSEYYGLASKEDFIEFRKGVNETVSDISEKVDGLTNTVEHISATVTDQGEAIASNYVKLLGLDAKVKDLDSKIDDITSYDEEIGRLQQQISLLALRTSTNELNITTESTRAKGAEATIAGDVSTAQEMLDKLVSGDLVLTQLLLSSVSDSNTYKLTVVMRDRGDGMLVPTIAVDKMDAIPSSTTP